MKTTEKKDVYGIINGMILEKLQQNVLPWKQSWNKFGRARNYVSNKPYRGINAMLLNHTESEYPLFLTFNQVKELGGAIKKGSKGNLVVFWKRLYYGNEGKIDPRKISLHSKEDVTVVPLLRYYYVFNIECVEGIEFDLPSRNLSLQPLDACEKIISEMPNAPVMEHGGDQPCYNWNTDIVKIPHLSNFTSEEEYYATTFHELAHSTGHQSRLDRPHKFRFGSTEYSFEELIAETTACFLCNEAGIAEKVINNSTSYIKGWLEELTKILKDDDRFFVKASTQAQRAADYILNQNQDEMENESEKVEVVENRGA